MVGGGVLRECFEDPQVEAVLSVGRRDSGLTHRKLTELVVPDLFALSEHSGEFLGYDACFYCLGVSSSGMSEPDYHRLTYDLTFAILDVVCAGSPDVTVCFVSGQGSDSTGSGRVMWARVKGQAENEVLRRDSEAFVFRPGIIQPLKGTRSKTSLYHAFYVVMTPIFPLLKRFFPGYVTTTVMLGRAMIRAASAGYVKPVLETRDINALGGTV